MNYAHVADVVREEIERAGYIKNSCILAARMTGLALRELRVEGVEAMACEVHGLSPGWMRMMDYRKTLDHDLTEADVDEWREKGAWRVELSFSNPSPGQIDKRKRGYNAHVVTLVNRTWLIDPSLAQVERPEKDLLVNPPFAFKIDYTLARERGWAVVSKNGTHVIYKLLPGRKDFTKAGDWRHIAARDVTVQRIVERITNET